MFPPLMKEGETPSVSLPAFDVSKITSLPPGPASGIATLSMLALIRSHSEAIDLLKFFRFSNISDLALVAPLKCLNLVVRPNLDALGLAGATADFGRIWGIKKESPSLIFTVNSCFSFFTSAFLRLAWLGVAAAFPELVLPPLYFRPAKSLVSNLDRSPEWLSGFSDTVEELPLPPEAHPPGPIRGSALAVSGKISAWKSL